jgi:hypothetical protein
MRTVLASKAELRDDVGSGANAETGTKRCWPAVWMAARRASRSPIKSKRYWREGAKKTFHPEQSLIDVDE